MTQETINNIVKASGVSAGECILVHFWGENGEKDLADSFMTAVAACGASPFLLQQSRSQNQRLFSAAEDSSFDEKYFSLFDSFDAVLDVFAYQPIVLGAVLKPEQQARYRRYISALFGKLVQKKRFTQIRIPTAANADESGLEPQEYIERMNTAYDINYTDLEKDCTAAVSSLCARKTLSLQTSVGCTLSFDLSGRSWHIDAGDGDLPCGEVYIAPQEQGTNGTVFFEQFWLEGVLYRDVVLYIENGVVCSSNNAAVSSWFFKQPVCEKTVCELGFGMNPNVKTLCGYTVLDEKMRNTFHIAIGANTMFGGHNEARTHTDFVGMGSVL